MTFVYGPGTLTKAEWDAALSSIWFNPNLMGDGRFNLTPEANIAVLRGARYDNFGPLFPRDMFITDKAMRDLATYLGFRNVNDYNSALFIEGSKIFRRAPKACPGRHRRHKAKKPPLPVTSTYPFPVIVEGGIKQQLTDMPTGESGAIPGKPSHGKPSIFDTGYYYEGEYMPGATDDFGSLVDGDDDFVGSEENP